MAFYKSIKEYKDIEMINDTAFDYPDKTSKIATSLLKLRTELDEKIPRKKPNSLIIGSWNIQNFDEGMSRIDESFHYIAEIIDKFDICAIQEVNEDLRPLKRVKSLLGPNWDYFVSDITMGDDGNSERMAFLFNKNKVIFRNQIGEVIPEEQSVARSPFFASFQAGWFRFTLCSSHITFDDDVDNRRAEISAVAQILKSRAEKMKEVFVMLGDMNIKSNDDDVFKEMRADGWEVKDFGNTTTGKSTSAYDKINYTDNINRVNYLNHGSFDWRDSVFRAEDEDFYEQVKIAMRGKGFGTHHKNNYKAWMELEMSDHLPIWMELETDFSDEYLEDMTK
ncbi:MAG: endonuclease/exonuclease/phosphatase family protein [Pseudomonadota bacterium]